MLFKIFESGKYPQGEFSPEQVAAMASAYDPQNDVEAPCVIGHLDNSLAERIENELAHGWVKGLMYIQQDGRGPSVGSGQLWADVEAGGELLSHVADGRLRYVSAEIAKREGDSLYLVRLAFLGRSVPAVATARVPAAFRWIGSKFGLKFEDGADEGVLRFCRKLEFEGTTEGTEEPGKNPHPSHGPQIKQIGADVKEKPSMEEEMGKITEEMFAAEQAASLRFQQEAQSAKAELAKFQQEQEKKDVEARIAKLRECGKLAPAEFEQAVGLALQLTGEHRETYFGQLEGRAPVLDLGTEKARREDAGGGHQSALDQLKSFAAREGLSFSEALERVKFSDAVLYQRLQEENVYGE
ncbi:MAG: hypothetical protein AAF975_00040 [Spirochaetota bacterium]